jgi:hypothetical protein
MQYGSHDIENNVKARVLNPVALTIPERRTFKLLCIRNFRQSTWNYDMMNANRSSMGEQLIIRPFLQEKTRSWERGEILKFMYCFMEATRR